MNCKNCGAPLEDNAKFCMSCGAQVEQKQEPKPTYNDTLYYDEDPFERQEKEQAPRQFGYNDSLQEGSGANRQTSNFYGKKFEAGTSGEVKFSNRPRNKRGSFLGVAVAIGVVFFVWFLFFGSNAPIYDIQIGAEVNSSTYYPNTPLDYVIESEGYLYVSYTTRDLDIGEVIRCEVIFEGIMGDQTIYSDTTTNDFEEQIGYFEVYHNWIVGDYEVRFIVDGEEVASTTFYVTSE